MDETSPEKTTLEAIKVEDFLPQGFPAGLRVLIVDDDPICLRIMESMLRQHKYEATEALDMLRDNRNRFDMVISDLHMPDMDGLKLLEIINGLGMDLPFVMVSQDDGKNAVLKVLVYGACAYFVKPLRDEHIQYLWQHVVRKRQEILLKELRRRQQQQPVPSAGDSSIIQGQYKQSNDVQLIPSGNRETIAKTSKKRIEEDYGKEEAFDDAATAKKPRMIWTNELHKKFIAAVDQLGYDRAVPKKILELMQSMGVSNITRENIASHLQKYRIHIQRRKEEASNSRSSMDSRRSIYDQASPLNRSNIPYGIQTVMANGGWNFPVHAIPRPIPIQGIDNNLQGTSVFERTNASSSNLGLTPSIGVGRHLDFRVPEIMNANDQVHEFSIPMMNPAPKYVSEEYGFNGMPPSEEQLPRSFGNVNDHQQPSIFPANDDLLYDSSFLDNQFEEIAMCRGSFD